MTAKNSTLTQTISFTNGSGYKYKLYPSTYRHIRGRHRVQDPIKFIKAVFRDTFAIFESKSHRDMYLYYSIHSQELYKVVVVNIVIRVIKTVYISDVIKKGDIQWLDKSQLLRG